MEMTKEIPVGTRVRVKVDYRHTKENRRFVEGSGVVKKIIHAALVRPIYGVVMDEYFLNECRRTIYCLAHEIKVMEEK